MPIFPIIEVLVLPPFQFPLSPESVPSLLVLPCIQIIEFDPLGSVLQDHGLLGVEISLFSVGCYTRVKFALERHLIVRSYLEPHQLFIHRTLIEIHFQILLVLNLCLKVAGILYDCSFGLCLRLKDNFAGTIVHPLDLERLEVAEVLDDLLCRHIVGAIQNDTLWPYL